MKQSRSKTILLRFQRGTRRAPSLLAQGILTRCVALRTLINARCTEVSIRRSYSLATTSGSTMWRERLIRTLDWLRSRRLVGEDEHHLFYAEFIEKDKPERRYVEYKDSNITHSSDRMSTEWWSWLHNRRDSVPSVDELAASARTLELLARRVAVLEAEDEKQRLRQFAAASSASSSAAQQDARTAKPSGDEVLARRRKNVLMRLEHAAKGPPNGASASADTHEQTTIVPTNDLPSLSRKDRQQSQQDSVGSGEHFRPDSWTPPPSRRHGKGR